MNSKYEFHPHPRFQNIVKIFDNGIPVGELVRSEPAAFEARFSLKRYYPTEKVSTLVIPISGQLALTGYDYIANKIMDFVLGELERSNPCPME